MGAFTDYFNSLTPDEQEHLHSLARRSILELPRLPMDYAVLHELLEWQALEIDVLEAHADWLSRTEAKFERNGWPWTTGELMRRSRLWEVE